MKEENKEFIFLNQQQYQTAKFLTVVVLPAIGTLYFAIAQIWGLPSGEQVLGTILAIEAFLGVVLNISTATYNKSDEKYDGTLTTTETPQKKIVAVETKLHPDDLAKKDEVLLKVE